MTRFRTGFDVVGHLEGLRRYACSLTRNEADAEDLVQDALVHALARRRTFRAGGKLGTWLLAIVHNTFVSGRRRAQAELSRIERHGETAPRHAEPNQDQAARLSQVQAAFMRLPEEQRAALHLVAVEGLAYQEAATTLGIPLGTLMSRIGRARATLRDLEQETLRDEARPRLRLIGGTDDPA